MEVAGANRRPVRRSLGGGGWRCPFRYRGSCRESAVAQLFSLGYIHAMSITRFTFCICLATFVLVVGCATKPAPDPLAGWQKAYLEEPNQIIEKDCQDYIQKLPPKERGYVGTGFYYKNGTGQHVLTMEIFPQGKNASWQYAFFYDKDSKRIKVVKYGYCRYQS